MSLISTVSQLLRYRALLWALIVRHLSIRYRGSVLGFLWTFLNPLCLMLVYVLVFRYYIRFNEVEHYTVFLFCGLLPWLWVASALTEGTSAVVSGGHLITKSMFPPQILPTVAVATSMINFVLSLPLLLVFMIFNELSVPWTVVFLPLLIVGQALFLLGIALALSSLNVFFRDVQHIVGNALTFLFFLSPILYPPSVVPERFQPLLQLNPLALLTQFYHQLLLDGVVPSLYAVGTFLLFTAISLVGGAMVFQESRESFAECL
jgi:ABC-type polysaccharide/polyol phosphate export permease